MEKAQINNDKDVILVLPFKEETGDFITVKIKGNAADNSIIQMIEKDAGFYEPDLGKFLAKFLKPNSTVLDIGANIGAISMTLGKICTEGKIFSFEPGEINFEYLSHNIKANNFKNIYPFKLAVSDKNALLNFSYTESFAGGSFVSDIVTEGEQEKVQGIRLDDWVETQKLKRIDLLKIDVEGSELAVIKGAPRLFNTFKPYLVIECNPHTLKRFSGNSADELFNTLNKIYPYIYSLSDLQPVKSEDELWTLLEEQNIVNLFCSFSVIKTPLKTHIKKQLPWLRYVYRKIRFGDPIMTNHGRQFILKPTYIVKCEKKSLNIKRGEIFKLKVNLTNTSNYVYSSSHSLFPVNITYQWLSESKEFLVKDGLRTSFEREFVPKESRNFDLTVQAPQHDGNCFLRISLVQENVHWFYQANPALDFLIPVSIKS